MIIATIIGKSFHNCIKTAKSLAKYFLWIVLTVFVMSVLEGIFNILGDVTGIHVTITRTWMSNILNFVWYGISAWIAYEIFVVLGIFHREGYNYSAVRKSSDTTLKYEGIPFWANVVSWIISLAAMALVVIVYIYFVFDDEYLGKMTLLIIGYISRAAGTSIPFTFVVLVLYGGALLCVLSCLSLLIPVVKYIRRRGFDVYSISGIASIAFFSWNIINSRVGFVFRNIGNSYAVQYDDFVGYIRNWSVICACPMTYTFEQEFILPILGALIFNAIVFYVLNHSVKSFGNNLYKVVSENSRLIEGTVDPMEDYFKEQKRMVDPLHDDVFATLVWTAYGLPMTGWELKQQYTKLGNALDDYAPQKVSMYSDNDVQRIKNSRTIIHSESRIRSVISNAQVYCKILDEFGTFGNYVKQLINVDDKEILRNLQKGNVSLYGKLLAADLHYRGFKYIGPAKAGEFLKNNYKMLLL